MPCYLLSVSSSLARSSVTTGIDEAGRGPLAGPVIAAAVVLDNESEIDGLADSKTLTVARRERMFDVITETALAYSINGAEVSEIDSRNILQATLLAMRRAFEGLRLDVKEVFVDGNQDPGLPVKTHTVVRGDAKIPAISAASILAKVTRDRLMVECARTYPAYGFERHKGYPTSLHLARLQALGPCPIHRMSFAPVKLAASQLAYSEP